MAQPFQAPLDLVASTVAVSAVQSATIMTEISGKLDRWIASKEPSTVVVPGIRDLSLLQGGSLWWCRGHAVPRSRVVAALGVLLASLLDHSAAHRAPAGLLYVVARATDPRHLAPLTDLSEFHKTIARYAAARPSVAIDALLARYAVVCSGLPALGNRSTISDVRRLRRAGGVPLRQISTDTAIPISLLRELEWGVYTNWNLEHARGALQLYAERAGLDPDAVARVIEHEQAVEPTFVAATADRWPAVEEQELAFPIAARVTPAPASSGRRRVPFALAVVMVGAILLGAPGDRSPRTSTVPAVVRHLRSAEHLPVAPPLAVRPANPNTQVHITPAVTPLPRRARHASVRGRGKAPVRSAPANPLLSLARAIAGDGRYRVEPFPKVKDEH